jgi:hypothetical protein
MKYTLSTMRPSGLGEFPVTSLGETELFEKFAVPQAEIFVQGRYLSLRDIQTFSGVNLDLSGIIRSLDFLLFFGQAKSRRKIEIRIIRFSMSLSHLTLRARGAGTRNESYLCPGKNSERLVIGTEGRPRSNREAKSGKFYWRLLKLIVQS